jgi:hypothetical protein
MIKGAHGQIKKEQGRDADQMIKGGNVINPLAKGHRQEQKGREIAILSGDGTCVQFNLGKMTDKSHTVPDHHQQTEALQVEPAHPNKGTSPDIPKKIAKGTQVLDMGKLMDHNTLDPAMGLQGPGLPAEQNCYAKWNEGKYPADILFHFILDPWCIRYVAFYFSTIDLSLQNRYQTDSREGEISKIYPFY